MSNYSKYERELGEVLENQVELGGLAFRMGGSGSGTADDRVDVVYGHPWTSMSELVSVLLFEAKYRSSDAVDLTRDDIEQPMDFAEEFGGVPYIALRWSHDTTWYFRECEKVHEQLADDAKTTRVRRDEMEDWLTTKNLRL